MAGKEDTEAEMGYVSGHELIMCEEVSWEGMAEVMKCFKSGKEAGPDGIMSEMYIWGWTVGGYVADDECSDKE